MGKALVSIYSALSVATMGSGGFLLFTETDPKMIHKGIAILAMGLFLQLLSINWSLYVLKENK